jgi:alpha-tubulin suppressor-like RCC1 family protein
LSFSALATGGYHTCGLTSAGAAYCWGWNVRGELGDGSTTGPEFCNTSRYPCSSTPVAVSGGWTFTALATGADHTCALTSAGAVYCWGLNDDAQLGVGTATGPETCHDPNTRDVSCSTFPLAVTGGLDFQEIATGGAHTCGLSNTGAAYCWGDDLDGELGNGSTTNSSVPIAVAGGLTFDALAAGGYHTCGLTSAGVAYCWGWNQFGQLGIGTTTGPETCQGPYASSCSTLPAAVIVGSPPAVPPAGGHGSDLWRARPSPGDPPSPEQPLRPRPSH